MKKLVALALAMLLVLSSVSFAIGEETDNPYANLDLSQYEEINFYFVGAPGADWQEIVDKVNAKLVEKINTKVNFIHVSYGDFQTKYSLYLSGDEDVDIIYGAAWCGYADYMKAGAYKGFDWDFVQTYMPLTAKNQAPASWKECYYDGKYYCIPRDDTYINGTGMLTTQAMLDKCGMKAEDINSYEKLAEYWKAIAADPSNSGVYAFNPQGSYPMEQWYIGRYHYMDVNAGAATWMVWKYNTGKAFYVNDLQWFADTEDFVSYAKQMAEFYKAGVFPASVISNETQLDDNFRVGTSATQFSVPDGVEGWQNQRPDDKIVYLDCFWDDQCVLRRGNYMGYGACFPVASKKTERAAVALDVMKNDPEINRLLVGGEEGRHYTLDENDNTYILGPEAADYGWGSWGFLFQHDSDPTLKINDPELQKLKDKYLAAEVPADTFPINGFVYDSTKYDAEITVISALLNEYRFSFGFGIYGDETEAKVKEFIDQCKAAGIDDIVQDYRDQLAAYIAK